MRLKKKQIKELAIELEAVNLDKGEDLSMKQSMNGGVGLMFMTLPTVFADFGRIGAFVGSVFFLKRKYHSR